MQWHAGSELRPQGALYASSNSLSFLCPATMYIRLYWFAAREKHVVRLLSLPQLTASKQPKAELSSKLIVDT